VANLGWERIKLPKPVFAGDTLYAESTVLGKRESKSRPAEGIISIRTIGLNQRGEMVCEFERTMLVMKRGHPHEQRAGY
jgi:itaconyl-CoA hydratase